MRLVIAIALWFGLAAVAGAQTSYRLQPGDTIAITVWQDSKLDRSVVVGPDGTITVPIGGHILARGLTLQALEAELKKRLQGSYAAAIDLSVALTAPAVKVISLDVFVTGEVNRPGAIPLGPQGANAIQAIAMAGGFSPFAATKRIRIIRSVSGIEYLFDFNYDDFIAGRDASGNIALRAGDVVVVPEKGLFGH